MSDNAYLVDHTDERTIAFCCRVSNPSRQNRDEFRRLLKSCIKRNEWSVLESSSMTMEFNTTRAISAQVLRHRSFTFQEFSQRWQPQRLMDRIEVPELRRKGDEKHESFWDPDMQEKWEPTLRAIYDMACTAHDEMVADGVHPECARMVLPLAAPTRLYVTGNIRSWYHYILLRTSEETQWEHRKLAWQAFNHLRTAFPVVGSILEDALDGRRDDVY